MATTPCDRVELFIDAQTGETVTRKLTAEEIAALPEPDETELP